MFSVSFEIEEDEEVNGHTSTLGRKLYLGRIYFFKKWKSFIFVLDPTIIFKRDDFQNVLHVLGQKNIQNSQCVISNYHHWQNSGDEDYYYYFLHYRLWTKQKRLFQRHLRRKKRKEDQGYYLLLFNNEGNTKYFTASHATAGTSLWSFSFWLSIQKYSLII